MRKAIAMFYLSVWFCSGGLCWLGGLFGPGAGVLWRFGFGFVAAAGSVGLSVVALFASLDTVSEIAYHCSEVHYGCDHSLRRSCKKIVPLSPCLK